MNAEEHQELCRDLAGMFWRAGQPKRLFILVALERCGEMDFSGLGRVTDISSGNLPSHLKRLQGFGYVTITRGTPVVGRRTRTIAGITRAGIEALERHFANLEELGGRLCALVQANSEPRGAE